MEQMMANKRFLVFAGYTYYPGGGMNDFIADYNTLEESMNRIRRDEDEEFDWSEIYDTQEMKTVYDSTDDAYSGVADAA